MVFEEASEVFAHQVRENTGGDIDVKLLMTEDFAAARGMESPSRAELVRDGDSGLVRGLYALCPFIVGDWPQARFPSSTERNGLVLNLHDNRYRVGYGIEAFEAGDPMAWPGFATAADVAGFPPTVISVNELDPLRDEGIEFYRTLLDAGVAARCRQVMGTAHATEVFPLFCPDISRDTARDLAAFCRGD